MSSEFSTNSDFCRNCCNFILSILAYWYNIFIFYQYGRYTWFSLLAGSYSISQAMSSYVSTTLSAIDDLCGAEREAQASWSYRGEIEWRDDSLNVFGRPTFVVDRDDLFTSGSVILCHHCQLPLLWLSSCSVVVVLCLSSSDGWIDRYKKIDRYCTYHLQCIHIFQAFQVGNRTMFVLVKELLNHRTDYRYRPSGSVIGIGGQITQFDTPKRKLGTFSSICELVGPAYSRE